MEPVQKLIEMTGAGFAEHKLMAVAVSGKSLDPLIGVIDELVAADVPVLVSHLTAEQVTSAPVAADTSLARVTPTTADEAAALAASLRSSSRRALIVQNSDCPECLPTLFPDRSVDDSYAIMAYDAVLTAVTAIRQPDESVSSPEAVIQEFKRLHGLKAVAGASGWISLGATGSPIDKAVAIMEVVPDGSTRFVQLSSPSGTPCRPGTAPC
jgi:hypothetical protein